MSTFEFVNAIWTGQRGYGEVRRIGPSGVHSLWFDLGEYEHSTIERVIGGQGDDDIYYGVLARPTRGARSCKPSTTPLLWCDVDNKVVGGDQYLALSLVKMLDPNIIVASGHGYHGYWRLEYPIGWEDASEMMRAIARTIKGDHVHDAARLLRLPGYRNLKDPTEEGRFVSVLRFDTTGWTEPERFWPLVELHKNKPINRVSPVRSMKGEKVPAWLVEKIEAIHPKGTRSEQAYATCVWLIRYGYTDSEIEEVFASHPAGIGEKYAEMGTGASRWMARTIAAAKEVA